MDKIELPNCFILFFNSLSIVATILVFSLIKSRIATSALLPSISFVLKFLMKSKVCSEIIFFSGSPARCSNSFLTILGMMNDRVPISVLYGINIFYSMSG